MFSNAKMVYIYQSDIGMIIIIIYNIIRTYTKYYMFKHVGVHLINKVLLFHIVYNYSF